jgi:cholesterol transport system auxiliary component
MTQSAPKRPLLKLAGAAALAVSLSGCITLLPKSAPADLYRFGVAPAAAEPARPNAVGVFRAGGQFQREAAGDQILTVTGAHAAYIAGARWVTPAEVLFDEAVQNAFEAAPGRVRLVSRGEQAHADYALRLDVRNFETDYGAGGAPSVLIRIRAVLTDGARATVAERMFEARAPAAENRVSAIVAAYSQALAQALGEITAWTNSSVA